MKSFSQLRSKIFNKGKQGAESAVDLNRGDTTQDLLLTIFNKQQLAQPNHSIFNPKNNHLNQSVDTRGSFKKKKESKELNYKKNDLNLSDYLNLYSMSKRAESLQIHRSTARSNEPRSQKQSSMRNTKAKTGINNQQSIRIVREQTKKQIMQTEKKLIHFLKQLDNTPHIKQDQQSLVFMCNVLHIFQEKVVQSVKYAQALIEERKKQKKIEDLKKYSKNNGSVFRKINKAGKQRLFITSKFSPLKSKQELKHTSQFQ